MDSNFNPTVGRSNGIGIHRINQAFRKSISQLKNTLKGPEYNILKNTINQYWQGADASQYLATLDQSIDKISEKIENYDKQFFHVICEDSTENELVTSRIANQIKKL